MKFSVNKFIIKGMINNYSLLNELEQISAKKKKLYSVIRFLIVLIVYLSAVIIIAYYTIRTYWPLFAALIGFLTTSFLFYAYYELSEKYFYYQRFIKLISRIEGSNNQATNLYIKKAGKLTIYKKVEVQKIEAIDPATNTERTLYILEPFVTIINPGEYYVELYQNIIIKARINNE